MHPPDYFRPARDTSAQDDVVDRAADNPLLNRPIPLADDFAERVRLDLPADAEILLQQLDDVDEISRRVAELDQQPGVQRVLGVAQLDLVIGPQRVRDWRPVS